MIPWTAFTGYLLLILIWVNFFNKIGNIYLPLSLQVHHVVCDGYPIALFYRYISVRLIRNHKY
ncbi:hypothetical protein H9655_17595 [Cytobacillus sp. Sa5YUA1]|uniref:Chloramphenicol acetyltransferase n=1 Tax=Cytobacillus stercorigallinarum TaxID=2762240 RepID=A0ABR8QTI8_9BACI|nr:hypothetical protein [Cytobacillus stercorigallinarum]